VSGCDAIRIITTSPPGFDFTSAVAHASANGAKMAKVATSRGTGMSANAVDIAIVAMPNDIVTLTLGNVKLGKYGGLTLWSVKTFVGGAQNEELSAEGFRLPGVITILQASLRNELDAELDPPPRDPTEVALMSPWIPRVTSPAIVEFSVRFSNIVLRLTELHVIIGTDYILRAKDLRIFPFNTTGYRRLVSTKALPAIANTTSSIGVSLLDPLLSNKDYVIILPLRTASNMASAGQWRFELRDAASPLPVQTNDAQLSSFKLAEVFSIGVSVGHASPSASILVTLALDFGVALPTLLSIVPPLTYNFPSNCSNSALVLCIVGTRKGRTVALLTQPGGKAFSNSATLEVLALSPTTDPALRAWSIEGLAVPVDKLINVGVAAIEGDQVGWGQNRLGIMLTPMKNVVIQYAAVPLVITSLSLSFTVTYRDGKQPAALRMIPPTSYRISCSGKYLKLVSLPAQNVTCTPEPFTLKLKNGSVFPEGRHLFIVEVRVPSRTPKVEVGRESDSFFRVLLLDATDKVLDSDTEVPAKPVQSPQLQSDQSFLQWTSSAQGAETVITFGFRLKRSIPAFGGATIAGAQPVQVAALLLEMPAGFQHLITVKEDVKNLNNEFPLPKGSERWAEYDSNGTIGSFFGQSVHNPRLLRILRDQSQRVPVGTYGFSLPVRIPVAMPRDNVWHLSLCSAASCSSQDDASVVISFVLAGFKHGEASLVSKVFTVEESASLQQAVPSWMLLPVLILVMWCK